MKFTVLDRQIPDEYKKYINSKCPRFNNEEIDFRQSGTLVIWKKCDRNLPKKASSLLDKLQINLGRKFRYLIENKEQRIFLISTDNESLDESILPNDPLFVMENNLVLGDRNTALREEKTERGSIVTSSENVINNCNEENEDVKTITDTQREKMTEEEKRNEAKEILKNIKGVESPTEDDIKKVLLNKVNIGYGKLSRTNFFEIETTGISCNCIINTNHIFYKKFISKLEDNKQFIDIFEIFLASIARVMNEMSIEEEEKIQDFLDNWNFKLTKYIKSITIINSNVLYKIKSRLK